MCCILARCRGRPASGSRGRLWLELVSARPLVRCKWAAQPITQLDSYSTCSSISLASIIANTLEVTILVLVFTAVTLRVIFDRPITRDEIRTSPLYLNRCSGTCLVCYKSSPASPTHTSGRRPMASRATRRTRSPRRSTAVLARGFFEGLGCSGPLEYMTSFSYFMCICRRGLFGIDSSWYGCYILRCRLSGGGCESSGDAGAVKTHEYS
ncbi:hypothetical protein B0J13DRAFT_289773 [Dactylonectria estremocensis]|uniref:Uncharacterized protein n=1 Tax=Dactylonectria estremocensis TaxID=1079267 RepID=A0A9P9JAK6_9HYPO|nr:hypothetical protein B0J13DRAFT_289773 [Dactylonectria estremocensis]